MLKTRKPGAGDTGLPKAACPEHRTATQSPNADIPAKHNAQDGPVKHEQYAHCLPLLLLSARRELVDRADAALADTFALARELSFDPLTLVDQSAGGVGAAIDVLDCGSDRFDFTPEGHAESQRAFVFEVFDKDGETVVDLAAVLMNEPHRALSLLGRVGIAGRWRAFNAGSYYLGRRLRVFPTLLEWLQAGCDGAAIIHPHIARRELLDLPGDILVDTDAHGHNLLEQMDRNRPAIWVRTT